MTRTSTAMHVATTRRQHNGVVYETHLLRHSFREGGKVKNVTLANLSHLPAETIELVRQSLRGETHVLAGEGFDIERSLPHGHVAALCALADKLDMAKLLGPACAERDLALSLVIARAARPGSKLATTRWWADTTLGADLVPSASADDAYQAMDWLLARQGAIESTLARRHLKEGSMVLYDLSSSWMEGTRCPLAARGYSRDHKSGKAQIEYGLMTDAEGRPVSVEVFPGNTADPTAFIAAVEAVRTRFRLTEVVMVGDRGMITSARIEALRGLGGISWVTCLRAPAIKALAEEGVIQLSLFDEANLAEITHPDYPGERLVACRNPALAAERARKRTELLDATEGLLAPIAAAVEAGRLKGSDKIGLRVGRELNRRKMAKHFEVVIGEASFAYSRRQAEIDAEAALDGIYVVRTCVGADRLDSKAVVSTYKSLALVERDFRSLKAIDLDLRPIYHFTEDRVRAHVLVCMLAAYLVWHLRQALAPMLFADEDKPGRDDPVAPASRSEKAKNKDARKKTENGDEVHDLGSLLHHLATLTRNTVVFAGGARLDKLSLPTATQRKAFELIGVPIPARLGTK